MDKVNLDKEFMDIVFDIMENKKFKKINECRHHGITRYEHSLRVAYYSYLITKKLKLNYIETARGGLLHDFFLTEDLTPKKQKLSMIFHPYKSLENADNYFNLTSLEKDIIINHMFPTLPHKIPMSIESWIVSLVDKTIAIYEFYTSYSNNLFYRYSKLYIVLLLCRF